VGQLEAPPPGGGRHGLTRALIPAGAKPERHSALEVVEVRTLAEAAPPPFLHP